VARKRKSWWQRKVAKWKRREGGVYLWRTRAHANPFRRENGYVGESTSFRRRERDHRGKTAYQREDGTVKASTEKPWMDLDAVCHKVIQLPWWLCWKPILWSLETLVMWLTWPRYNDQKNHWNPRRVTLSAQRAQRAARDAQTSAYRAHVAVMVFARRALQVAGVLVILAGLVGAVVTR
jgi:hypothetical protein